MEESSFILPLVRDLLSTSVGATRREGGGAASGVGEADTASSNERVLDSQIEAVIH